MAFDLGRWLPEFPVRENCLYLDHASRAPWPRSVTDAVQQRSEQHSTGNLACREAWQDQARTCRHLGGELLGCDSRNVAVTHGGGHGLDMVLDLLHLDEPLSVLVGGGGEDDGLSRWVPADSHPLRRFHRPDGRLDPDEVAAALDDSVGLLVVPWVDPTTGWIAPVAQLGGLCRDRGIPFVIDATQALGVLPMDLNAFGADAVVVNAHTWLMGPGGIGLIGVSEALEPAADDRHAESFADDDEGTILTAGLAAALDLVTNVGPAQIHARLEMLGRVLARVLVSHGWELVSPGPGHPIAGIVAARHPKVAADEAVRRLSERRVIVGCRDQLVRFSPHFYTTKGELEALDRILAKVGL